MQFVKCEYLCNWILGRHKFFIYVLKYEVELLKWYFFLRQVVVGYIRTTRTSLSWTISLMADSADKRFGQLIINTSIFCWRFILSPLASFAVITPPPSPPSRLFFRWRYTRKRNRFPRGSVFSLLHHSSRGSLNITLLLMSLYFNLAKLITSFPAIVCHIKVHPFLLYAPTISAFC